MSIYEQQQQELNDLCLAVIHEKDPKRLTELIAALNVLLEQRETASGALPRVNEADAAWKDRATNQPATELISPGSSGGPVVISATPLKTHRLVSPILGNGTVTTRTLLDWHAVARYLVGWGDILLVAVAIVCVILLVKAGFDRAVARHKRKK